jgi:hypothetical protein
MGEVSTEVRVAKHHSAIHDDAPKWVEKGGTGAVRATFLNFDTPNYCG